jgi:hypothetical protein
MIIYPDCILKLQSLHWCTGATVELQFLFSSGCIEVSSGTGFTNSQCANVQNQDMNLMAIAYHMLLTCCLSARHARAGHLKTLCRTFVFWYVWFLITPLVLKTKRPHFSSLARHCLRSQYCDEVRVRWVGSKHTACRGWGWKISLRPEDLRNGWLAANILLSWKWDDNEWWSEFGEFGFSTAWWIQLLFLQMGVFINGGTPSHHPFYLRIFPSNNHPAMGLPPCMETSYV